AGHELVLVHGGGNQIRDLCRKLGLPDRYHDGLRITDGPTADVVLMVLAGLVNKELVHALDRAGARAAGLSGADGRSFAARGVLDADGARRASLSHRACLEMRKSGVIRGGMIPKVEAALAALDQHPSMLVKIAPADGESCVLAALDDSVGTRFIEED